MLLHKTSARLHLWEVSSSQHFCDARNMLVLTNFDLAVIFGDPENGQAVSNIPAANVKEFCAQGDGVCGTPRTYQITSAHLSYGQNATAAANFIAGLL